MNTGRKPLNVRSILVNTPDSLWGVSHDAVVATADRRHLEGMQLQDPGAFVPVDSVLAPIEPDHIRRFESAVLSGD